MKLALIVLAVLLYLPLATWLFYLAGMNYERVKRTPEGNGKLAEFMVRRILWFPAAVHNATLNAVHMSVLFWDWPRELATTKRLNRYVDQPERYGAWRAARALWLRAELLNPYDPDGVHT